MILKLKKKIIKDISEEVYDVKGEYSFWMDGEKLNQSMGEPKEESIWCKEFRVQQTEGDERIFLLAGCSGE